MLLDEIMEGEVERERVTVVRELFSSNPK